jgi:hypothetical protein
MRHERLRPSFETPRKGAAPQDEGRCRRRNFFITFVNAMFTTFMRVRFTNVFERIARIPVSPCVWRAGIAD